MRLSKLVMLRTAAIVFGVLGAGWVWFALTHTAPAQSTVRLHKVRLKLKWFNQAQFAGFYVANEKGYFRQRGLDVSFQAGPADTPLAVVTGAADIGVGAPEQVLMNRAEGHAIRAIGVVYQSSPACWMVRADSAIHSLSDLTNQNVGVQAPGRDFDILYRALTIKQHVDRSKLHERQVDSAVPLFLQGQLDVLPSYSINEPFIAEKNGVHVRCINPGDFGLEFYGDTIMAADSYLKEHGEEARSFLSASIEGWSYALEHIDEAVDITLKQNADLPRDSQVYMLQQSAPLIRQGQGHLLMMNRDRWEFMAKTLAELGVSRQIQNIDQVFSNCFLPMS